MLQEKGKAKGLHLEHTSSLTSIEEINNIQVKISLQPLNIHVRAMKDFHFGWVVQYWPQSVTNLLFQLYQVDNKVLSPG